MIKPGTLCMIRGVPHKLPGGDLNGSIVTAVGRKGVRGTHTIWHINPPLKSDKDRRIYTGASEQWLHPFDDHSDDLKREAQDEVLERTFCETLEQELEKIK